MSIKLLVADDSITIQKVIGIIFGGEEYSLTVVDNGRSAIEKAREICPDVLLIDALMPGMTGYEVSEAVRATPALANKPILILTGSFEPFDEEKAKRCGADDFLAKPFESQQIVNKVRELAELGASREHAVAVAQASVASVTKVAPTVPASPFITTESEEPVAVPVAPQPQTFDASDIWGAFTTETESPDTQSIEPAPHAAVQADAPFEFAVDPDVFTTVNEEPESCLVPPAVVESSSPQNTGSQWIPVEEHTFESEETAADISTPAFNAPPPAPNFAFGDIAFEDEEPLQAVTFTTPVSKAVSAPFNEASEPAFGTVESLFPSFDVPSPAVSTARTTEIKEPVQPSAPEFTAMETPAAAEVSAVPPTPITLTEDQLKAAISAASKEMIERIIWEVVPDLAEVLIKEAIRKIKEGH